MVNIVSSNAGQVPSYSELQNCYRASIYLLALLSTPRSCSKPLLGVAEHYRLEFFSQITK